MAADHLRRGADFARLSDDELLELLEEGESGFPRGVWDDLLAEVDHGANWTAGWTGSRGMMTESRERVTSPPRTIQHEPFICFGGGILEPFVAGN